jgi:predicted O-methyltransferase YrrM
MHPFSSDRLHQYAEQYSSVPAEPLEYIERQTHLTTTQPIMLSGHLQGRFLSAVSHMIKPQLIVELGTFTGYSALCLAEGLSENGQLISIDIDQEQSARAQQWMQRSPLASKITLLSGQALHHIPNLPNNIDLVFIDADKPNYLAYYEALLPKLKQGGFILADNVLFHGKVCEEPVQGKNAQAMHAYNQHLATDERVETVLIPLRDGLMLSRKK